MSRIYPNYCYLGLFSKMCTQVSIFLTFYAKVIITTVKKVPDSLYIILSIVNKPNTPHVTIKEYSIYFIIRSVV